MPKKKTNRKIKKVSEIKSKKAEISVPLNIYVTSEDRVRLNVLAAQIGLSVQKIVRSGIDREMEARGLPLLAPATSTRVHSQPRAR